MPSNQRVKIDPPTWKADTADPKPSSYDEESAGFWIRVGNTVWFSVVFFVNQTGSSSDTTRGSGDYYWEPTVDGAPSIDPAIYNNTEGQMMTCGVALVKGNQTSDRYMAGYSEIDDGMSRIYGRLDNNLTRVRSNKPIVFAQGDAFHIAGTYPTINPFP